MLQMISGIFSVSHGGDRMTDFNNVVVSNIKVQMKKHHTKQIEMADVLGVSKSMMSRMLKGNRRVRIDELHRIADYYHIQSEDLMRSPAASYDEVMRVFMERVRTDAAREALRTADELADMTVFHANVRKGIKAVPGYEGCKDGFDF